MSESLAFLFAHASFELSMAFSLVPHCRLVEGFLDDGLKNKTEGALGTQENGRCYRIKKGVS